MTAFGSIKLHVTNPQTTADWLPEDDNEFVVLSCHQILTPLGGGGMGDWYHECAPRKSAASL